VTQLPDWGVAILVCLPNLALGVILLIYCRSVASLLAKASRRLSYAHPTVPMVLVIVAGVFQIVVAGGGLVGVIISALSN